MTRSFASLGEQSSSYAGDSWNEAEIEMIDQVLSELHAATGTTNLLKTAIGRRGDLIQVDTDSSTGRIRN